METLWTDPQYRTEGERTDAIVKRLQAGIASLRQSREDYGYSAEQIARLEVDDRAAVSDPLTQALVDRVSADAAAASTVSP